MCQAHIFHFHCSIYLMLGYRYTPSIPTPQQHRENKMKNQLVRICQFETTSKQIIVLLHVLSLTFGFHLYSFQFYNLQLTKKKHTIFFCNNFSSFFFISFTLWTRKENWNRKICGNNNQNRLVYTCIYYVGMSLPDRRKQSYNIGLGRDKRGLVVAKGGIQY